MTSFNPLIAPLRDEAHIGEKVNEIAEALSQAPAFSFFSTTDGPNTSGETADRGTLGIERGSAVTTLWVQTSNGTNNWVGIA